jgi:hypothetical protein
MEREDVEWTRLAQGSDQWWAFVNTNESSGSTEGEEFLDIFIRIQYK